jgi:hypothetical protein
MIREIELARPKYLIAVHITSSWLKHPGSEALIHRWANEYLKEHYDVVGAVNIVTTDRTDYYFGELPRLALQPVNYILIYQRKT